MIARTAVASLVGQYEQKFRSSSRFQARLSETATNWQTTSTEVVFVETGDLIEEQSGPTCVPQVQDQLAVGKPDNLEPGVVRRMADSPQPPWKFWLRVGSAAVGVGVGWLMFPVWSVSTCFPSSNLTLIPGV